MVDIQFKDVKCWRKTLYNLGVEYDLDVSVINEFKNSLSSSAG